MNVAKSLLAVLALGSSMAMDDMIAGQQAVKTFQAANLEYMACLETQFTAAKKTIEEGKAKDAESLKAAYEADVAAYNEAVSAEEALAGQFNTEIREFRAANPG